MTYSRSLRPAHTRAIHLLAQLIAHAAFQRTREKDAELTPSYQVMYPSRGLVA